MPCRRSICDRRDNEFVCGEVLSRSFSDEPVDRPPPSTSASNPLVTQGDRVEDENIVLIQSPMVGTFYTRANPDAEPFVKVGDQISPETTVCVIEAMKVFNEIPAEISGEIVAVLAENEEAVEYGKPLFKVDTSR